MVIASGLGAQVAFAPESTYGTYVAGTKFCEVNKFDIKPNFNRVQGGGLAAGRQVQLTSRYVETSRDATASVEMEVTNKGMGYLLQALMGTSVTPVQQAATTAYLQTHTLADNRGKSLSFQVGVPEIGTTSATVRPYTLLGAKVTQIEFSAAVDEILTAAIDLDCQDSTESQTLVAASYPTTISPFHWGQAAVKLGAFGSEAAVDAKSFSLTVARAQNTERFYMGNSGLKKEPILNDWQEFTGTLNADFVDKTVFSDRYRAKTPFSLIVEFVGPNIASTYFETIRFKMPSVVIEDGAPSLDGPDVVNTDFTYRVLNDGTNAPLTIEYMSTDVTL
jgi:hypothetical protein